MTVLSIPTLGFEETLCITKIENHSFIVKHKRNKFYVNFKTSDFKHTHNLISISQQEADELYKIPKFRKFLHENFI